MNIRNRIKEYREVLPSEVAPNPRNWRLHPDAQREALRGVLADVGIAAPVIAYHSEAHGGLMLIDGHERMTVGVPFPAVILDVSDEEAATLLATFDPLGAMAQTDSAALDALLRDVSTDSPAVAAMLDALAQEAGLVPGVEAVDDPPADVPQDGPTRAQSGDLWLIDGGRHRLIVGDSTDPAVVGRLMGGERADMVFTSPPYNRGTTTGGGFNDKGLSQQLTNAYADYSDDLPKEQYYRWQAGLLAQWWELLSDDGAIYYNHRPRVQAGIYETPLDWNPGLPVRQIVIWNSGGGINFAPTHYRPSCEWIVIYAKPDFRLSSKSASGCGDVWEIPVAQSDDGHPAPFPVALPQQALETTTAMVVLDPFLGSGTTLIAAHRTGRRCYGVEISPRYADVILRRAEAEGLTVERAP